MLKNRITYRLWGKYALFADPITKIGGELCTYQIPTYQSLIGITESIYWKPTFFWVIDRVKIIKRIQTETKSIKLLNIIYSKDKTNILNRYTYLCNVEYIVEAHFEWDLNRSDLTQDRDEIKHSEIAKKYLTRGGKRDIFIGKRECVGFVEPCMWDNKESYYKNSDAISFGIMFHSFIFPNSTSNSFYANLDDIVMHNGVINFKRPEDCKLRRKVRDMEYCLVKTGSDENDNEITKEDLI